MKGQSNVVLVSSRSNALIPVFAFIGKFPSFELLYTRVLYSYFTVVIVSERQCLSISSELLPLNPLGDLLTPLGCQVLPEPEFLSPKSVSMEFLLPLASWLAPCTS